MTIDATSVGRSYSAAADPYQVGREKIREFAEAIGDPNPAYRGDDAIAPPTFAFMVSSRALDLLLADPDLGLRLDRIVHGAQKFSYVRPIKAGGRAHGHGDDHHRPQGRRRRGDHVRDRAGHRAGRVGRHLDGDRQPQPGGGAGMSEIEVGTELPPLTVTLRRADLVRYAGAGGDFNPIHFSDRMAASMGLPGVIAHGMLTMAQAARVVTDWLKDPADLIEYGVRFTKPVVVPDDETGATVVYSAKVDKVSDGTAEIDITAVAGEQKVLGRARAVVRVS
jgi:acyl dehydratase